VKRSYGGNDIVIKYEGTISGDELKLKITQPNMQGGDPIVRDVTAKREKS
jgi:hypothetical protein